MFGTWEKPEKMERVGFVWPRGQKTEWDLHQLSDTGRVYFKEHKDLFLLVYMGKIRDSWPQTATEKT